MRELSGLLGVLYSITEWIMRFFVVNIVWFILNIPIGIILLSALFTNFSLAYIIYYVPLLVLIPLLFVPSTVALFAMAREWVLQIDHPSITKAYFMHMKSNYKKSVWNGIILMIIWLIWLIDFYYFTNEHDLFRLVFSILGAALFVFTINFLSLNVHFQMNKRALLKNTFFITMGSPVLFFAILMSNYFLFYVSATKLLFLIPFFTASLCAYLSFAVFYKFSLKIQKKALNNKSV